MLRISKNQGQKCNIFQLQQYLQYMFWLQFFQAKAGHTWSEFWLVSEDLAKTTKFKGVGLNRALFR